MKDGGGQIRRADDKDAPGAKLSALSAPTAVQPADNGVRRIPNGKPPRLRGVVISASNTTARRRTYEAYWRDEGRGLLSVQVAPLVAALFDNIERRRKLAKARDSLEARVRRATQPENRPLVVLTLEGKTRLVEDKIGDLDKIILKQLDALGWTPIAMARLGIDVARMSSFAAQMQEAREGAP